MAGPLSGLRIIEVAGIGPGPFAGLLLSDMGAEVISVDRPGHRGSQPGVLPASDLVLRRGRRSIAIDLKTPEGGEILLRMVERADAIFEPYRPGVAERLGIGPDACMARNPRLVYGRMTGWGQDGPYARMAGHDINYIALGGALFHIGEAEHPPVPPLNLVGDFGGGGMLLAFGLVCALIESQRSGQGQVVDAAMIDGVAALTGLFHGMMARNEFDGSSRGEDVLEGGSPFYGVYECGDGGYVSIGAIEPQFYGDLVQRLGLDALPARGDRSNWAEIRSRFTSAFKTKSRDEWCAVLEGTDVCFAPVLRMSEVAQHPHNVHRSTFIERGGVVQPGPVPRLSRTPGEIQGPPPLPGQHTDEILTEFLGATDDEIAGLRKAEIVA